MRALRADAQTSKSSKQLIGFGNPLLDGDTSIQWEVEAAKAARRIKSCAVTSKLVTTALRGRRRAVRPLGRGTRLVDAKSLRHQSPLPETADELCSVARSVKADINDIYLGSRATEATIKDLNGKRALAQYMILHFATHGTLAGELKGRNEPGLILTPPTQATQKDDGYLSASEIAGLKLDADGETATPPMIVILMMATARSVCSFFLRLPFPRQTLRFGYLYSGEIACKN